MSDTVTPSDSVSQTNSTPKSVGGKQQAKRRPNKTKQDARSKFNPSAPSISSESFFTEFIEKKRNNVEIIFDTGVQGRLADLYVTKARDHAVNKYHVDEDNSNLQASTFALISLTLCRKMLLSVPDSEEFEMGKFRNIWKTEFMAPKSAIAAVANVGKFELEDKIARLKYNSQDIFRMMMTMCKVMYHHSDYHHVDEDGDWTGTFGTGYLVDGVEVGWDEVDVSRCVITSEASVRWLRDEAKKFLDQAYLTTWNAEFTPPPTDDEPEPAPVVMSVSYPRLAIDPNPDKQIENVVAWLGRLNARMPGVQYVIAAGFATAWKLSFFQRIGHLLTNIVPGLPDWIFNRPYDILVTLGLQHFDLARDDYDGLSYLGFMNEIHRHVITNTTTFAEFLDLTKQPDDKFGSAAQLLPYNRNDFQERPFLGMQDFTYQRLKSDAQSLTVTRIKDKGDVVAGLVFGFSSEVQVVPNFIGRLNGDPNNIKTQYLKPDLKYYN
jgi:hypothetical protein